MREMTVYGVSFDLVGKQPIVLLKTAGRQHVPADLDRPPGGRGDPDESPGHEPPRPMTHDLACAIIASLDAEIDGSRSPSCARAPSTR